MSPNSAWDGALCRNLLDPSRAKRLCSATCTMHGVQGCRLRSSPACKAADCLALPQHGAQDCEAIHPPHATWDGAYFGLQKPQITFRVLACVTRGMQGCRLQCSESGIAAVGQSAGQNTARMKDWLLTAGPSASSNMSLLCPPSAALTANDRCSSGTVVAASYSALAGTK